jgi:hypothetical protein
MRFCALFRTGCDELHTQCDTEVIVVFVDDGSVTQGTQIDDHTPTLLSLGLDTILVRHPINRGQGTALQTAIEIAKAATVSADVYHLRCGWPAPSARYGYAGSAFIGCKSEYRFW